MITSSGVDIQKKKVDFRPSLVAYDDWVKNILSFTQPVLFPYGFTCFPIILILKIKKKGGSKAENKSTKSSENSGSGNASDTELISSKASQQSGRKHNKYTNDSSRASLSILTSFKNHLASFDEPTPRKLDKIPNELRLSKSSFRQAMRNEVYLDVV